MNAKQAKEQALETKKQMETVVQIRKDEQHEGEVKVLTSHFNTKIEEAVKKGHLSVGDIVFPINRFTDEVIREVGDSFKRDGYNVSLEKHNAYQNMKFSISWN